MRLFFNCTMFIAEELIFKYDLIDDNYIPSIGLKPVTVCPPQTKSSKRGEEASSSQSLANKEVQTLLHITLQRDYYQVHTHTHII